MMLQARNCSIVAAVLMLAACGGKQVDYVPTSYDQAAGERPADGSMYYGRSAGEER